MQGVQSRSEDANPRGKAVEAFSHLLAEVRAYGQGVLIADQVPVKFAQDVIKNTNLKIVHRVVAADDRHVMANAMAMDEAQTRALSILTRGQAAVFSEGDDAPVLIKVSGKKDQLGQAPDTSQVAKHMRAPNISRSTDELLLPTRAVRRMREQRENSSERESVPEGMCRGQCHRRGPRLSNYLRVSGPVGRRARRCA